MTPDPVPWWERARLRLTGRRRAVVPPGVFHGERRPVRAVPCGPCFAAKILDHPAHACAGWSPGRLAVRDGHFAVDVRLDERPAACPCACRDETRAGR
ncbi:hypothetical protein JNUCC64_09060 [Streptomyces sp. JNUCC 64]